MEGYSPLKAHPFFESITWENLHHQTPPKLTAYLPAMSEDDEDCYGNVSQRARAEMGPAGPPGKWLLWAGPGTPGGGMNG